MPDIPLVDEQEVTSCKFTMLELFANAKVRILDRQLRQKLRVAFGCPT